MRPSVPPTGPLLERRRSRLSVHPLAMRPAEEYRSAVDFFRSGVSDGAIASLLGTRRETIRDWRRGAGALRTRAGRTCPICGEAPLDGRPYAYLLGLYLGDGCLSVHRRGVYRLRISLDARQPEIVDECARAVAAVAVGKRVGRQSAPGCVVVSSYWKHWACLFPQHGSGKKHERRIGLAGWQRRITRAHSDLFLKGLIQSDGCRVTNRVRGRAYPRYHFSNRSRDILRIFCQACDDFGVSWTRSSFKDISVARAADTRALDQIIGPKG